MNKKYVCIQPTVHRYLIDFRYPNFPMHNTSVHVFTMHISGGAA